MKNKGFTLAETLITLTIIGVVASMTLPSLNTNIQKAQAAPSLMKAINTLQNALSLGMTQNNLRNLNSFANVKDIFDNASKGPLFATLDYYNPITVSQNYLNSDGTNFSDISTNARIYTTKDGIDFILPNKGEKAINELSNMKMYGGQGFTVYIDTNGYSKNPNKLGKDTFKLIVDTKGLVIPYGSYEYAKYTSETEHTPLWKTTCNSTTVTDGAACTGSIVDNGHKVVYKY